MSSSLTKYLLDQIKWLGYDIDIEACKISAKDQDGRELYMVSIDNGDPARTVSGDPAPHPPLRRHRAEGRAGVKRPKLHKMTRTHFRAIGASRWPPNGPNEHPNRRSNRRSARCWGVAAPASLRFLGGAL